MSTEVSTVGGDQSVEGLGRELAEAREQQAVTAEILRVITSSPTDLQRVFAEIAKSAARLCDAYDTVIRQVDGDVLRLVAHHGPIPVPGTIPLSRSSLLGCAVNDRRTIHVADMQAEADEYPESRNRALQLGHRTTLGVPLVRADRAVGVILIRRTEVCPFTERQIDLLKTFADQAVIAIENTRLLNELRESLQHQTATADVLKVISRSAFDLPRVLDTLVQSAARLCEAGSVGIMRPQGPNYHFAASHGFSAAFVDHISKVTVTAGRGSLAGRVLSEGRAIHVHDILADPEYVLREAQRIAGYRTMLGVPLLREGTPIGVMVLTRNSVRPFTDKEIALVGSFADHAVIAIENTRLFEAEQARTKELQESLEYQTATSDVLGVISKSPNDLQPVLDVIVQTASRLAHAHFAHVFIERDSKFHLVATNQEDHDVVRHVRANPIAPGQRGSILARAIARCATVHVPDTRSDPEAEGGLISIGAIRSSLAVPLLRTGRAVGGIVLTRNELEAYTDREIRLVETFADQAVIAMNNARLFEEVQARTHALQESLEYQTAMSDVLAVISSSPDKLQPVLDAIVNTAKRLCIADRAYFNVLLEGRYHSVAATEGIPKHIIDDVRAKPEAPGRGSHAARAVLEKRPIHIKDTRLDPEFTLYDVNEPGRARTLLGVPLLRRDKVIGVITLARIDPAPFTQRQIDLVATFANQAVIAINNVDLFEEVQARTKELAESLEYQTATSEVLSVISKSPNNLQPVLDAIVVTAQRLCQAEYTLFLKREDDSFYHVKASVSADPQFVDWVRAHPVAAGDGSMVGIVAGERQAMHFPDCLAEPRFTDLVRQRQSRARTMLGVPLLRGGEAIGVIFLARTVVQPFTDRQIALVTTFANQAVIAIENARLFEAEQASKRELQESLEYQTAAAEVLDVISRSPTNSQPVLDTIAASVRRLIAGSAHGAVFLFDGEYVHLAAHAGIDDAAALRVLVAGFPQVPDRGTATARALLTRQVAYIPDVLADDEYRLTDAANAVGFRSIISVPMLREGLPIGAINVTAAKPAEYSEPQIALLQTFANQAVIAINNAGLFEEVQARNRDLTALSEVGRAVSSTLDLKMVLKTVIDRAVELSSTDGGAIFYFREGTGKFELGETTGLNEEVIARFRKLDISAGQTGLGEAIARREPLQVPDILTRPSNLLRDAALEAGLRAGLIVPLFGSEGALGALVLQRRHVGEFPPSVVSLMQAFADQSAIALENARLFEEIAQKSRELEIASQHKSQFVANMSHELRTPLAAILGYAELMQEGFYGNQSEKSMDALIRIRSNGKHLLGLINTVLDIAKIESGQFTLNMAEYAIESVVETVRSATESLAQNKKLALKTEVAKSLPIGLGDEQRLTQVLLNLVGNAIKFTDAGEVRVTANAVNGHFNITVVDTGPGIPLAEQTRIFEQFHQVDSSLTKAKGGTGLGLAIAKQIVEMHGGRIWVESTVGKGSTFQMELPTRAATT